MSLTTSTAPWKKPHARITIEWRDQAQRPRIWPMKCRIALCLVYAGLFPIRSAYADRVDDYIKAEMEQRRIPGVALNIIQGGKSVKTSAYGLANIELNVPVKPE